jgi:hypothetical protein
MAHDASKLMDIPYITESEAHTYLFCTLSCISFADIDAKVSAVDGTKISDGTIVFFYREPRASTRSREPFREVTVTNLGDPENRKVTSRFVESPTFKPAEANVPSGSKPRK